MRAGGASSGADDPHETNAHGAVAAIDAQSTNTPARVRPGGEMRAGRASHATNRRLEFSELQDDRRTTTAQYARIRFDPHERRMVP